MSGNVKNTVLAVVGLAALIYVGWSVFGRGKNSDVPNTVESQTDWICAQCGEVTKLTAREITTAQETEGKAQFANKQILLNCPKCKAFTVVRAGFCQKHDKYYADRTIEGATGDCDQCLKEFNKR